MDEETLINLRAGFVKADEKLRAAKILLDNGEFGDSISRSYYAVFHAGEALLRLEGLEPRTHEGLKVLFGEKFVKSGRFPVEAAKLLNGLKRDREDSDYSLGSVFERTDAEEAFASAGKFVQQARRYVESQDIALG